MRILVDAMGGDNAPGAIVSGCVDAVKSKEGFDITLIGDKKQIERTLRKEHYSGNRIAVLHATQVITNEDKPTIAIKQKKDSSIVVGFDMLNSGTGDAFLSAGSSGALLAASLLLSGRMQGVIRPALGAVIPTSRGGALLIDAGLNSSVRPESLVQFAHFGTQYMKGLYGIENPRVGLINIGQEDEKGPEEIKEANLRLKECGVNYVGNLEGNDVIEGMADVIVCDGFVGNVLLKFFESTGNFFMKELKRIFYKNLKNKIAAAILRKDIKILYKPMDPNLSGGAPILGINDLVIKSHGSSKALTIKNVVLKTVKLVEADITGQIRNTLEQGGF